MFLAFLVILVGVFLLRQHPSARSNVSHQKTTTTTVKPSSNSGTTDSSSPLSITSGPTWVSMGTPETITLNSAALKNQSGIEVSLEVFPKIESRSQFQFISKYGVKSLPIASSPPVDVTRLSKYSTGNPQLSFEISETSQPTTSKQSPNTSFIQIPYCSPNCAGVYPLLAVFVKNSQVIHTALTRIALESSTKVTKPLNFAMVVQAPFSGNTNNDLKSLALITADLQANPLANVTVDIPGIVLEEALSSSAPTNKSTISQLVSWAALPNHQIITSGFVPINFPRLVSSGLSGLIKQDLSEGTKFSNQLLRKNTTTPGPIVINGGLSNTSASLLANNGVSKILLGQKYFAPFNQKYSLSQPFLIEDNQNSALEVLSSDSELRSDLSAGAIPYTSANQISTDLAQIYFDQPNDISERVVSTLFRVSSPQQASNLNAALNDITSSPFVHTTDLQNAFSLIPTSSLQIGKLGNPAASRAIDVSRFKSISSDVSALDSSLGKSTLLSQAQNSLMASLTSSISSSKSQQFLNSSQATISQISSKLSLAANKSFTVTSRNVKLPIAISSQLKVPFKGVLVIKSDRLSFPNGNTVPVVVSVPNTTLSIPIHVETLGIYLISAKLFTTNGKLVVAHTSIEIRSTAFSLVSIILTLGAFLILALWWIQSFRKGHRRNRRLVSESK
jgi:hypothetical protein